MDSFQQSSKTVFINLDLIFDFYSVLFSVYKTYFISHPLKDLKHLIIGKNFDEGVNSILEAISLSSNSTKVNEELKSFLDVSLKSIKPTIGAYTLLRDLSQNGTVVKLFTNFEEPIVKYVKEAHKSWLNYEIIEVKNIDSPFDSLGSFEEANKPILINSSVDSFLNDQEQTSQFIPTFIPNSKKVLERISKDEKEKEALKSAGINYFESLMDVDWNKFGIPNTLKWPEMSYYLKLDTMPANQEYHVWNNISSLPEPIEISSQIIHGFGRGGRQLGIPTANLKMTPEIDNKIEKLATGVYYGWAKFVEAAEISDFSSGKKLPMVMSIGFNPYYENDQKTAEVHIMENFETDFYGENLSVQILGFIRNEADFMKFSHLVEAIHNDVQVAKDILNSTSF